MEIGIVAVLALLVFGSRRLPEVGRGLGQGIRGFGKELKDEAVTTNDHEGAR